MTVNVMLGILEMDSIVLVSKIFHFIMCIKYFTFLHHKFFFSLYFTDIDECLSDPCHINANCSDNPGSYDCQCNVGYSGNGFNCSSK